MSVLPWSYNSRYPYWSDTWSDKRNQDLRPAWMQHNNKALYHWCCLFYILPEKMLHPVSFKRAIASSWDCGRFFSLIFDFLWRDPDRADAFFHKCPFILNAFLCRHPCRIRKIKRKWIALWSICCGCFGLCSTFALSCRLFRRLRLRCLFLAARSS